MVRHSDINRVARCTAEDGVTPEAVELAERRIMPLLTNWRLMDYDLKRLLVSCYLQGIRDLAETAVNRSKEFSELLSSGGGERRIPHVGRDSGFF